MLIKSKTLQTIDSIIRFNQIASRIRRADLSISFIFQSYQIGGAERVHADIMRTVKHLHPTCFITTVPVDKGFERAYKDSSTVIELKRWASKKSLIPVMARKIAKSINKQRNPVVFGCDPHFFYQLIPYLKKEVKIVDLTHAFTEHSNGVELASLPYVDRIDVRIVLGKKTLNDYAKWYRQNGIDESYLSRFRIIPNQVAVPTEYLPKDFAKPLNIVFVSRNSREKRPELFFKIVRLCTAQKLPVHFTAVGDFQEFEEEFGRHVVFTGRINDAEALQLIYLESHLIMLTSIIEGFPMVLLESMARGVVPITTNVGEIPNYISQTLNTGFLVDNTLPEEEIIASFIGFVRECINQPMLLRAYSEAGYNLVKQYFNPEQFRNSYLEVLTPSDIAR